MESMTGFGRAIFQGEGFQVVCLAKSVNHRYLEISLKLPRRYALLEERIRKEVMENFSRGKIEITLRVSGFAKEDRVITFDLELAKRLKENLLLLKETLLLPGEITLAEVLSFREITSLEEKEEDLEALWLEIEFPLKEALRDLKEARLREGLLLKEKIRGHFQDLKELTQRISQLKERVREDNLKKMKERVAKILEELGGSLDEGRLYQEIAFLLDRLDITEEVDRLSIHLDKGFSLLDEPQAGKKLDFLCQEMQREITTLSNKAQSAEISHLAIQAKDLVEKIREQIQNIV